MKVKLILLLAFTGIFVVSFFTPKVSAGDDGSGCSDTKDVFCYEQKIYQQNQVIEKQNQQLIKLEEISVCYDAKNAWDVNHGITAGWSLQYPYGKCIDLLDSETK